MKAIVIFGLFIFSFLHTNAKDTALLNKQLQHKRVANAAIETDSVLRINFEMAGLHYPPSYIYWRCFKKEHIMELWAADSANHTFKLVKTYPIYRICGDLGPKRMQGDMQIPEGFYHISLFNPASYYWLSFKVSYPNGSDSLLSDRKRPGGDIYVHGDSITIGCLPLTDSLIKEVYWISLQAQVNVDSFYKIPIHIFPTKLNKENWQFLYENYFMQKHKIGFWNNLQEGYNYFEVTRKIPKISVDNKGRYIVHYPQAVNTFKE